MTFSSKYEPFQFSLTSPQGLRISSEVWGSGAHDAVIFAHGFGSDRHSNGRFDKLVKPHLDRGREVVRFDFTGFGLSEDAIIDFARYPDELATVIDATLNSGVERIILHGHSMGTATSILAGPRYSQVIGYVLTGALIGPSSANGSAEMKNPGGLLSRNEEAALARGETISVNDKNPGTRRFFRLNPQGIQEIYGSITQEEALKRLRSPVLVINGTEGVEKELSSISHRGLQYLPSGSQLVVIKGSDHSFLDYFREVTSLSLQWSDLLFDKI